MKIVLRLILTSLLISGCIHQNKRANVFEDPVCTPPCWENITPGITKKTEALTILSKIKSINQPINDPNKSSSGFDDLIRFTFNNNPDKAGFLYILDDKVVMIGFYLFLNLTIQQAIDLLGEPQSLLGIRSGEIYSVTLINDQKGFAYNSNLPDRATKINPKNQIYSLILFDPKIYPMLLKTGILSRDQMNTEATIKNIRPWEGFVNLNHYMTPPPP